MIANCMCMKITEGKKQLKIDSIGIMRFHRRMETNKCL